MMLCSRLTKRLHRRSAGLTSWLLKRTQLRAPPISSRAFSDAPPEPHCFASASTAVQAGARPHLLVRCVSIVLKALT